VSPSTIYFVNDGASHYPRSRRLREIDARAQISEIAALPVIELDKLCWQENLTATLPEQWIATQQRLAEADRWIMDGDLGPYDALEGRLLTQTLLSFWIFQSFAALGEPFGDPVSVPISGSGCFDILDVFRPLLMSEVARHAPNATLHVLRNPAAVRQFIAELTREYGGGQH
jgi:hypothetical protein